MLLTHAFSRAYLDEMVSSGNLHSLSWMQESITRNASLNVFSVACDAMAETDVTGLLAGVTAPTLVLHGDEDPLTPLDAGPGGAGARAIAEGIPGAKLTACSKGAVTVSCSSDRSNPCRRLSTS